ncbi:hypothetical protein CVT26_015376 [Gymnopilus dilepis]|uniref:Ras GEF n=1 Tax=Gymnopilus dilepis TaxID=231916 RepID=A0A409WCZ1_9AGAR|nr:hypothetical protein CVT26_015376 [Gymnopilus dilepis]
MHSRLAIDTTVGVIAGPSSARTHSRQRSVSPSFRPAGPSHGIQQRGRSISNASTSSSISVVSPTSSSTNASTTSLSLPNSRQSSRSRSRSASPAIEETVRLGQEYVLALHDYVPPPQNTTCLSFREGQVIHVLSRDPSGWWDGELEGRRGWFPSNYVSNMEITSLTEEEPLGMRSTNRGHSYSQSSSSATSWATIASKSQPLHNGHDHELSITDPTEVEEEDDPYCPPLMVPLLHGLSLLQNAVRSNRIAHFQPSTACIISCVRSILASTDTLQRDAPILQRFSELAEARKKILTILAALVAQAKKASDAGLEGDAREVEVDNMLRLGAQVFSHVRTFLAIAIKCGVELPEDQDAVRTATPGSAGGQAYVDTQEDGNADSPTRTPTQHRGRNPNAIVPRPGVRIAGPRSRERPSDSLSTPAPKSLALARQEQYLLRDREHKGHKPSLSVDSISSASSRSSQDSVPRSPPPFPRGPSTAVQVMDALRFTHDHYLSTIAAFIGHAHSHSRTSYASSTGVLYELVKEIVDMVCKLLTLVEAVMQHPDIPQNRIGSLKSAKEGLYNVTSALAESVRLLTLSLPPTMSEEEEKQVLLRSATAALKAGADCVAAVKVCLNRSAGGKPFIVNLPDINDVNVHPFTPMKTLTSAAGRPLTNSNGGLNGYRLNGMEDEDLTIQAQTPSPIQRSREISSGSDVSNTSKSSFVPSEDTRATSPEEERLAPIVLSSQPVEPDLASPTSFAQTDDDGTTWEGSARGHLQAASDLGEKIIRGELPTVPIESMPEFARDPSTWMFGHDYSLDDVAYNSEGHLVGATMEVLVEKMTPHDSIVDPAFAAVFFLTFRLFSSPSDLVDAIIFRYNLLPPSGISNEDLHLWQQRKGIPVRLRVSNFIKMWVESYWRPGVDDVALPALTTFTRDGLATLFPGPASRILDLLNMRKQASDLNISPKADRTRDPGMAINPPTAITPTSEIPRPTMTKTLLAALRKKDFNNITITDFDALELARQLTIMECNLYCAIQPEEILESGQEGAAPPVNVRAVSTLSTVITGWVAESILNEPDIKKRTLLVKFFVKVADRCTGLNNFSTSRSILAALDSSVISRLHQTWNGLPQKYKAQLESLRRLADHSRNYHEYRSKLRNTAPPAVPFLGLYLTDVTFCREGNPSHRASPTDPSKKLLNFNKYHKLARIVQDMQRFQAPYNLKAIPEVQEYLNVCFEKSKHHGDLQDLYRRSLLVEPKQPADNPPVSDMRQLFSWATRSQSQASS